MRRLSVILGLIAGVACQRPTYLPVTALGQVAPACGAYPIAPRPGDHGPTYFSCQVDRPAEPPADPPLAFPAALADAGAEGDVRVQFVIDERGRVDSSTVKVLTSSHDLFARAAGNSLREWAARPAERRGRRVRQLATHAFCFRVITAGMPSGCAPGTSVACTESWVETRWCSDGGCRQPSRAYHRPLRCS